MDPSEVASFLSSLSSEEQAVIRPVLERDLEFQRREKQRLKLLKTSVDLSKSDILYRMDSTMKDSLSSESFHSTHSGTNSACPSSTNSAATSPSIRACSQCSIKLGFLFNSGTKCKRCSQLICDSCRIYTNKDKKSSTCPICFKEREFLAASGEWVLNGEKGEKDSSAQVSELLLSQLSRLAMDKRNERRTSDASQFSRQRAPPMRARNLTLPAIHHNNLLLVPNENGECVFVTDSSPPKRSASPVAGPRPIGSMNGYSLMPGISPREVIGSPAPRAAPSFPISPVSSQPPPLPESIPEDGSPSTSSPPPLLPLQSRHRRQSWHTANRIRYESGQGNRRQSVQIPKIVF